MEQLKRIAYIERKAIGGVPTIYRYWDANNVKCVDIYEADNRPENMIRTCATIGLSQTDINLMSENKDLRIELVGSCDNSEKDFPNIVATVAFEIMDKGDSCYGDIIDNVISEYVEESEMEHVYLMNPFLWEELDTIDFSDKWVTWLMIIPISNKEKFYALKNGYDALENLFEEKQIDIYDLHRKSVV